MSQKKKRAKKSGKNSAGLWLAPRFKMKTAPLKQAGWGGHSPDPVPSRLLELADKALEIWEYGLDRYKARKVA